MPQRFYFHDATTTVDGTLPGATSAFGRTATGTATGASTNRTMDATVGAGQTSASLSTAASSGDLSYWYRRFISDPLAAQTFPISTITISVGGLESNANSDMFEQGSVMAGTWDPGGGTFAAGIIWASTTPPHATTSPTIVLNEPGTAQTHCTGTGSSNAEVTLTAGHVLVVELWSRQTQAMATSYTNTIYYDGTTEGSTTNIASYIDFGRDIALEGGGGAPSRVPRSTYAQQAVARSVW